MVSCNRSPEYSELTDLFVEITFSFISATECSNDSLPLLDHGRIEKCVGNGNKMDCVGVCDMGYLFQNASNSTSYSCINGTWNMGSPPQSCTSMYSTEVGL